MRMRKRAIFRQREKNQTRNFQAKNLSPVFYDSVSDHYTLIKKEIS